MRYTVGASQLLAEIYHRDMHPVTFADYSHDPYVHSPIVQADVGPGKPWVLETSLTNAEY
ncbi:hypothetical protein [Mycolicibacterium vinylchloridicum]|uniref:hypothetical protein n=1 Tax=Mycolicibacterium vinylchloridicum TaxID=2736928 RepID=UPI0015C85699|nr:hypothetical protein [Mycolicibacterium vinylchloridicum]